VSIVDAAWAYLPGGWKQAVRFHVSGKRIERIETGLSTNTTQLIVPAVHNAHSHAFQWEMRGHSHSLERGHEDDDFWSWRNAMYALAERMTPARAEEIATELYTRMVSVGYGSVGEFHYLHHSLDAADSPLAMAEAHARAAEKAGIRLVLLPVAYNRGGFGKPAAGAQTRFSFATVEAFLTYVTRMRSALTGATTSVGVGVHSVRAVPRDWLRPIAEYGRTHDLPIHVHASEQRGELLQCRAEYGTTPIHLLAAERFLGPSTTVVHATHLEAGELEALVETETNICICPTTERDLGDGLPVVADMLRAGAHVCVGSDSHSVVDAREEMRLLELNERMRLERRNVLTDSARGLLRPGDVVLGYGTAGGARSLGLPDQGLVAGAEWRPLLIGCDDLIPDQASAERAFDRWLFC
jgi:formimidoylglutamate deiminase